WQDSAGKPATFATVVHTWCLDLERASSRGHRPRLRHAVADHQRVPGVVAMVRVLGDVLIHLSFERRHQHAPGPFAYQRVQIEPERFLFRLLRSDYSQHAAYLSLDGLPAVQASTTRRVRRAPHPRPDPQLPTISPDELTRVIDRYNSLAHGDPSG